MKIDLPPEDMRAAAEPLLKAVAGQLAAELVATAATLAQEINGGQMDKAGAAAYLHQKGERTIENWMRPVAEGGRGLPHYKIGETVLFSRKRIDAWLLTLEKNSPPVLHSLEAAA